MKCTKVDHETRFYLLASLLALACPAILSMKIRKAFGKPQKVIFLEREYAAPAQIKLGLYSLFGGKLAKALDKLGIDYELRHFHEIINESTDNNKTKYLFINFPDQIISLKLPRAVTERGSVFLHEPPSVLPDMYSSPTIHRMFARVYTLFEDIIDNDRFYKFYEAYILQIERRVPGFNERKLCALIGGNKMSWHPRELYSERINFIRFAGTRLSLEFDFWGRMFPTTRTGPFFSTPYPTPTGVYKGSAKSNFDTCKNYKFLISYENMRGRMGYCTEKLLYPLGAGCIPIYWGVDNPERYVPRGCFIDRRDFGSTEDLYNFMLNFDKEDYKRFRKNVENYFTSGNHLIFSLENHTDIMLNWIWPDYPRHEVWSDPELATIQKAKISMNTIGDLPEEEKKLWGINAR